MVGAQEAAGGKCPQRLRTVETWKKLARVEARAAFNRAQRTCHIGKKFSMRCYRFASVAMVLAGPVVLGIGTAFSQAAKPELKWAPCGDVPDTECAGLPVPIDYAKPDGAKITLRLRRRPSTRPSARACCCCCPAARGQALWRSSAARCARRSTSPSSSASTTSSPSTRAASARAARSGATRWRRPRRRCRWTASRLRQNSRRSPAPTQRSSRAARRPLASCCGICPRRIPLRTSSASARRCRPTMASSPTPPRTARPTVPPISKPIPRT